MDDSCAVCAEALEWVAYGSCGHREVCSTCVARLRFVLNDPRCCLCKLESSTVFVTKALGDYTRLINDFSVFPSDATEGRVGPYWYHEDTRMFFDDADHYKMIKAMCKLSCSICDKNGDEQKNDGNKRRSRFKNIEQLKGHLFHRHRLFMCTLCLEGRKVFICEQKLYTRGQLNQHISTGDSEVDGSESERGGFMGHPMCEFCRNPFYGDNELYLHMSREHYTCHICQRQNPGQYDYYKNYDDLEIHFRNEHFLCENEACLAKKFVVFQSELEMKRHNALEHGGHMSRSKRNAALQIPVSFRYRHGNEQDRRRGRGRGSYVEPTDEQVALAVQASFVTSANNSNIDPSSNAQIRGDPEMGEDDPALGMESLSIASGAELPSRYLQAVSQSSRNSRLDESFFPPLSGAPSGGQLPVGGPGENTMAARIRHRNKGSVKVLNSAESRPWASHGSSSGSSSTAPAAFPALVSSSSAHTSHSRSSMNQGVASSNSSSLSWARPASDHGRISPNPSSSSQNSSNVGRFTHSASAPNLVDSGLSSSFMPNVRASRSGNQLPPASDQSVRNGDVQTANKTLVERIRSGLGQDEDKFTAFKEISAEYRHGLIDSAEYLSYVEQFGLSHLVLELAKLCPDAQKQRELMQTYYANMQKNAPQENGASDGSSTKVSRASKKGKGKQVDVADSIAKETLADNVINTVKKLQANYKPLEEVEVLSKDGYRIEKGKANGPLVLEQPHLEQSSRNHQLADSSSNGEVLSIGGVKHKQKKTSKFHRVRRGDGSATALLDLRHAETSPERKEDPTKSSSSDGLPVRGVWRNGGGLKLVAKTQRGSD